MTFAIIPHPAVLIAGAGEFLFNAQTTITASEGAEIVAAWIAERLRAATGFTLPLSQAHAAENTLSFELVNDFEHGAEGYTLDVTGDAVRIRAQTPQGLFYAVQTFRQHLPPQFESGQALNAALSVPAVHIEDSPRFSWRGLMLDVCRHFFPVSFVKKFIDTMALYKFNVLHWHLTDDQGWRIEIKKYPRLTEVGAWRDSSMIPADRSEAIQGPGFRQIRDGQRYGGFYTQEDIREIVAYAQSRFITVVPEIEMPGHAVAALTSYPELGCVGSGYQVRVEWGIAEDVLCAGKENTYTFIEDVLSEVVDLFPSEYIHIGGDECPKVRWESCPDCQAAIKREGLKDEHELQSYLVRRAERILESKGRRLIGWDEILEGGLAPNATVMSWRGAAGGIEAAASGHEVVMTPNTHCYLDYYQTEDGVGEPPAIWSFLPLPRVYTFDPTAGVPDDKTRFILGGQGNIWSEYMDNEAHVEYMVFPRALALAEAMWSPLPRESFGAFFTRLESQFQRLDHLGVNYRKPQPNEKP